MAQFHSEKVVLGFASRNLRNVTCKRDGGSADASISDAARAASAAVRTGHA